MIPGFTFVKLNKQVLVFLPNMLIFIYPDAGLLGTYNFKLNYLPGKVSSSKLSSNHILGDFLIRINIIKF